MNERLNSLHDRVCEGLISDYVVYELIKKAFNAPKLTFYDFGIIKQTIERTLKQKGY